MKKRIERLDKVMILMNYTKMKKNCKYEVKKTWIIVNGSMVLKRSISG